MSDRLIVRGAREHNLQDVSIDLPRDRLIVFTGLSGSGKSSLAFDTIYAEGQRRYVESLSAYARQFLGQMDKPDVDFIEGLSPAISIDQKSASRNPRSTVGTITEIYDYLRLLYARVGIPHCPKDGNLVSRQTPQQIVDRVLTLPEGTRFQVLAPVVRGRKGEYESLVQELAGQGFAHARVDGTVYELAELPKLARYEAHTIEVVVDRLVLRPGIERRLTDSLETALKLADGVAEVQIVPRESPGGHDKPRGAAAVAGQERADGPGSGGDGEGGPGDGPGAGEDEPGGGLPETLTFSQHLACPVCGTSYEELAPRNFSFNSPYGACARCDGLGTRYEVDPELVVPDPDLSIDEGAVAPWAGARSEYFGRLLQGVAETFAIPTTVPWKKLKKQDQKVVLYGSGTTQVHLHYKNRYGRTRSYYTNYEGVVTYLQRRHAEAESDSIREQIEGYMRLVPCSECGEARLKPASLAVTIGDRNIFQVCDLSIREATTFVEDLRLSERDHLIADRVLHEVRARLQFLVDVGLDYLSLNRNAGTLAGGEAQRIRLASQIGSGLVGVLYVLDEPSIGLHQRDNRRLIDTLVRLRDLGNTVIVVEHDEETIRTADHVVDIGPGAGEHGGRIVVSGTVKDLLRNKASLTGQYLSGKRFVPVPTRRGASLAASLSYTGAKEHNLPRHRCRVPRGVPGRRDRRVRFGQVHVGQRHFVAGFDAADLQVQGGARASPPGGGDGGLRQSGRRGPVAHRPHPPEQPRHLHRRVRPCPAAFRQYHRSQGAWLPARSLLVQCVRGPLRCVLGRRHHKDRDALPARRVRAVRGLQGRPLQPRHSRRDLQGQEHRRRPGHVV